MSLTWRTRRGHVTHFVARRRRDFFDEKPRFPYTPEQLATICSGIDPDYVATAYERATYLVVAQDSHAHVRGFALARKRRGGRFHMDLVCRNLRRHRGGRASRRTAARGSAIVGYVARLARAEGCRYVEIDALLHVLPFYGRRGFRVDVRRLKSLMRPYMYDDQERADALKLAQTVVQLGRMRKGAKIVRAHVRKLRQLLPSEVTVHGVPMLQTLASSSPRRRSRRRRTPRRRRRRTPRRTAAGTRK